MNTLLKIKNSLEQESSDIESIILSDKNGKEKAIILYEKGSDGWGFLEEYILDRNGGSNEELMAFLNNQSEEEISNLKKLARLSALKREIEQLENEIK